MAVPALPSLAESPGLSVDPIEQVRRSSGTQVAAVLHFHEPEDETPAGHGGDVDEIRAGPSLVLILNLALPQGWEKVPHVIDRDGEPVVEGDPAVVTRGGALAIGVRHRERNQFRGRQTVAGEANREPSTQRLQMLEEKLGVAAAAAQSHLV
ncbi:MAG: hypothetical protein OXI15_25085, partial [Chromatiales bacterium]|nr:hypothetical protein [Chromatiales bacterium]